MANHEFENQAGTGDRWVDGRIALLARGEEMAPNAAAALRRLRDRHRARAAAVRRWRWTTMLATGVVIVMFTVPASRACAEQPGACVQRLLAVAQQGGPLVQAVRPVAEKTPVLMAAVAEAGSGTRVVRRDPVKAPLSLNFKAEGVPDAAVGLEVYIDYDCVHCENFVREVLPELRRQYVATGQVRLLWRNFPMPTHRFARLAARYAEAAGALGYYGVVMEQIFATRQVWDVSGDGDIDAEVAKVVPAAVMVQLREHLMTDTKLDEGIEADRAAGQGDHLDRTPFAVIVHDGKREAITDGPLSFEALKSRIEAAVAGRWGG